MLSLFCRRLAAFVFAAVLTLPAHAQEHGDAYYQPTVGQAGKDVIWVPTPDEMVMRMLTIARVGPNDVVYDLGAGDGKIAIAAARDFGARAVGIEYNSRLADLARRNAVRAGVAERVRIITGDIFVEDFSEATVVTLYLLPELNLRLKPKLLAMRPGTRVVSHNFDMGDWEADVEFKTSESHYGYFWVVPARVEGEWRLRLSAPERQATLRLRQSYQKVEGTLTLAGRTLPIEDGRLEGRELRFRYTPPGGAPVQVTAEVDGRRLTGQIRTGQQRSEFTGERR